MTRHLPLAAASVLAAAALLGACGGDDEAAQRTLGTASERLGALRSGDLDLDLELAPTGGDGAGTIGFRIDGPVGSGEDGKPRADVEYTQRAGEQSATIRLVANGTRAFACADGNEVALTPEQAQRFTAAVPGGDGAGALRGIDLRRWIAEPEASEGEPIAGDPTTRITGRLRAGRVLRDLARQAADAGAGGAAKALADEDADDLSEAIRTSDVGLSVGREDGLLRRLDLELEVQLPERLRESVGFEGARLRIEATIAKPNATTPEPGEGC